jgi:2-methylcitrate dehydratase PrpD
MLRNARPQTGLEAKFSMQFAMAAALVARKVGLTELTDTFVRRADVQAIFPRVSFTTTDATMPGTAFAPADSVAITTTSGETLQSGAVAYAKGSHQHPLSHDELWAKFADCLGEDYPETRKSSAFENLMIFDRLNGAADLALKQ